VGSYWPYGHAVRLCRRHAWDGEIVTDEEFMRCAYVLYLKA